MVAWQMRKSYLSKEDESLYTYAYVLLIGQAVNILIACLLAVIFHAYVTVLVYLVSYIPLRSYAGGHHAETFNVCTVVSTILLCIICITVKVIPTEYILSVNLTGALISGFLIFLLAPVQANNKPLEQEERMRYRKRSRVIWTAETVLWVILYLLGAREVSLAITLGHLSLAILLWIGTVKNKYLKLQM